MNEPEQIILELKEELRNFRSIILELDMPTIDQEAALSQVFDALHSRRFNNDNTDLMWAANDLALNSVGLAENWEDEDDGRARAYESVIVLGEAIQEQLAQYGAYRNGHFQYEFEGFFDYDTVLLRKIHPETASADPDADDRAY